MPISDEIVRKAAVAIARSRDPRDNALQISYKDSDDDYNWHEYMNDARVALESVDTDMRVYALREAADTILGIGFLHSTDMDFKWMNEVYDSIIAKAEKMASDALMSENEG